MTVRFDIKSLDYARFCHPDYDVKAIAEIVARCGTDDMVGLIERIVEWHEANSECDECDWM